MDVQTCESCCAEGVKRANPFSVTGSKKVQSESPLPLCPTDPGDNVVMS